jgi:SAM-dependent methyltransferase
MEPSLEFESARLKRSWMRHEAGMLGSYLVADVEDPRVNLQSIWSRHFLLRRILGSDCQELMQEECRFSAVMNWLLTTVRKFPDCDLLAALLHALERGADNAEGVEIPGFVMTAFSALSRGATETPAFPNYLRTFLESVTFEGNTLCGLEPVLSVFQELWRGALTNQSGGHTSSRVSVLEPACGSANDYRFMAAYGLAAHLDYTGFDLCEKNIENALRLFPQARFHVGNVFEIAAENRTFQTCFVHDLFEHLSERGIAEAVNEIARVTDSEICASFFNMDEIPSHEIIPYQDYHWNRLSVEGMRRSFLGCGFEAQVVNVGTFLSRCFRCDNTHNPNAYTFFLRRTERS